MAASKYKPEMCDTVIELMREGASITEVAAKLGVSKQGLYMWREQHADFEDAIIRGTDLSQAWWEELGRDGASGKNKAINPAVWIFNMKNRFGWRDKTEHDHSGTLQHHVRVVEVEKPS